MQPPAAPSESATVSLPPNAPLTPSTTALSVQEPEADAGTGVRWRVLVSPPLDGASNMALDEALMLRAGRMDAVGEAVLRIYGWSRPTLSLGRNQTARDKYDIELAREKGIDFVRRPTGGRAVLHHREVTYSVTAPVSLLGSLRESYAGINRLLIHGLRLLGVHASEASPRGAAPKPGISPCFMVPAKGEIVADGRKLVGSAQVREGSALLQHGSVLVDDDQALASALLLVPVPPPPPPATLHELLGRVPTFQEVAGALAAALPGAEPLEMDPRMEDDARRASARYRDDGWTWRR